MFLPLIAAYNIDDGGCRCVFSALGQPDAGTKSWSYQSRGRSPRGLSAGPTVNPDDVKDVLGKYERLEKLAESFFVTKPTRQASCEESGRSRSFLPPIFVGSPRRTTAGFGVFD